MGPILALAGGTAIAEQNGDLPSLTTGLVILTGILKCSSRLHPTGASGMRDPQTTAFVHRLTSHCICKGRAFQINVVAGTLATITWTRLGLVVALLAPPRPLVFR